VAEQPGQIVRHRRRESTGQVHSALYPPIKADSIAALAVALGLDPEQMRVRSATSTAGPWRYVRSHGARRCATADSPYRNRIGRRLDRPPYCAYPLRPGITFTYLGVAVNEQSRVIMEDDTPADNIFAAGEIMAGNVLGKGYLAGIGMTIGTVFGRIAGMEAARHVLG
jgi:tricarballylate dehydrogenase